MKQLCCFNTKIKPLFSLNNVPKYAEYKEAIIAQQETKIVKRSAQAYLQVLNFYKYLFKVLSVQNFKWLLKSTTIKNGLRYKRQAV